MKFEYRMKGQTQWMQSAEIMKNTDNEYDWGFNPPINTTWEVRPIVEVPGGPNINGPTKEIEYK